MAVLARKIPYVPSLPPLELEDRCSKKREALAVQEVRVGPSGGALAYNHGIWLTMSKPPGTFDTPISRVYPRGTVRGHAAVIIPLGRGNGYFFCGDGFRCHSSSTTPKVAYYPYDAIIYWTESGVRFSLEGPFKDRTLQQLAEKMLLRAKPA